MKMKKIIITTTYSICILFTLISIDSNAMAGMGSMLKKLKTDLVQAKEQIEKVPDDLASAHDDLEKALKQVDDGMDDINNQSQLLTSGQKEITSIGDSLTKKLNDPGFTFLVKSLTNDLTKSMQSLVRTAPLFSPINNLLNEVKNLLMGIKNELTPFEKKLNPKTDPESIYSNFKDAGQSITAAIQNLDDFVDGLMAMFE